MDRSKQQHKLLIYQSVIKCNCSQILLATFAEQTDYVRLLAPALSRSFPFFEKTVGEMIFDGYKIEFNDRLPTAVKRKFNRTHFGLFYGVSHFYLDKKKVQVN